MPLGLRGRPLALRGGTRRGLYHTTPLAITALVRASRAGPYSGRFSPLGQHVHDKSVCIKEVRSAFSPPYGSPRLTAQRCELRTRQGAEKSFFVLVVS